MIPVELCDPRRELAKRSTLFYQLKQMALIDLMPSGGLS